jgi:hypothetical protein
VASLRGSAHASRPGPLLIPRHALDILAKLRLKPTSAQAPLRQVASITAPLRGGLAVRAPTNVDRFVHIQGEQARLLPSPD